MEEVTEKSRKGKLCYGLTVEKGSQGRISDQQWLDNSCHTSGSRLSHASTATETVPGSTEPQIDISPSTQPVGKVQGQKVNCFRKDFRPRKDVLT